MRKKHQRGYILMMVIAIGSLLFLAGIAAVSISSQDCLEQRFQEQTLQARCAADRGIAQAADHLLADRDWHGQVDGEEADGSRYRLDFAPGGGLNNAQGRVALEDDGHQVSAGLVCLISRGAHQDCRTESGAIMSLDDVLFDDTFSAPPTGWLSNSPNLNVTLLGKWALDLKLLSQTYLTKGDQQWRNYTYEVTVLLSQVTNLGLVVRAQGEPESMSGYVVGYSLLEDTLGGGTFYLNRMQNGHFVERIQQKRGADLGLGGLAWLLNLYHTYKITVKDGTIVATVDGKQIINATIDHPIKRGRVGILPGLASTMLVDRVTVKNLPEIRSHWRTL